MYGVCSAPVDNKFLIQTTNGPMRFRGDLIDWRIVKDLGLSYEEAAALCGLPAITIKRAAAGTNVTMDTLLRIVRPLSLKPEYLLKEGFQFRRAVERAVR